MMIGQAAFKGGSSMLRCALHCHTTKSDGDREPAELLQIFARKGYDAVALTDHDRYNFINYAPETGILLIPGVEIEGAINGPEDKSRVHVFHQVGLGRPYQKGFTYEQDDRLPPVQVDGQRAFIPYVDQLHSRGNLTIYCHPEWSGTPARDFEEIPGNFAIELYNTSCALDNDMDTNNGYCWDELLRQGKHIFGVAVDDCHIPEQEGLGWVMVNAEKNVDSILDALEKGAFYSSCGPEIYAFYVEDGIARVRCSPCRSIILRFEGWPSHCAMGEGIQEAQKKLPRGTGYVRAECVDAQGRRTWSNPIFL